MWNVSSVKKQKKRLLIYSTWKKLSLCAIYCTLDHTAIEYGLLHAVIELELKRWAINHHLQGYLITAIKVKFQIIVDT